MEPNQPVARPMWCDNFDADLPKVVPDARAALGDVADLMLRTHASLAANGMMSHPTVWNHELGLVAVFWRTDRPASKPAHYYTREPVVDLTLWEAVRDAWVHSYVILLEDVWVFNGEAAHAHFDPLMWHVRKWPGVSDEEAAAARIGAVLTLEHCRAKVRTLLRGEARAHGS